MKAMSEKGGAAAAVTALTAKAKLAGMWREKVDQHNTGKSPRGSPGLKDRVSCSLIISVVLVSVDRPSAPVDQGVCEQGIMSAVL